MEAPMFRLEPIQIDEQLFCATRIIDRVTDSDKSRPPGAIGYCGGEPNSPCSTPLHLEPAVDQAAAILGARVEAGLLDWAEDVVLAADPQALSPFDANYRTPPVRELTEVEREGVEFLLARKGQMTRQGWDNLSERQKDFTDAEFALDASDAEFDKWSRRSKELLESEVDFELADFKREQDKWLVYVPDDWVPHYETEWSLEDAFCHATCLAPNAGLVDWLERHRGFFSSSEHKKFEVLLARMRTEFLSEGRITKINPAEYVLWLRPVAEQIGLQISRFETQWARYAPRESNKYLNRQQVMKALNITGINTLRQMVKDGIFPVRDAGTLGKPLWRQSTFDLYTAKIIAKRM